MPINGDEFIKRMDSFVKATDEQIKVSNELLKRMEKFLESEAEKAETERKQAEKRSYVKVKDPLEEISSRMGKSNDLLQDILEELKKKKGYGNDFFDGLNLKNLGLGAAAVGAALGSESLMNKVAQEAIKPIVKKVTQAVERQGLKKAAESLVKKGSEVATKTIGKEVIEEGTEAVTKKAVETGAKKTLLKTVGKNAAKIGKYIPGIGFIVATPFAIDRIQKGDYAGAALEVASAIPGPLGWVIAAGSAANDIWWKSDEQKQLEEGKGWFDPLYDKFKNKAINSFRKEFIEEPKNANSVFGKIKKYDNIIEEESKNTSLNANLIRAIIAQESAANEKATSPAGAQGLMQLMPKTAEKYGAQNPYDPRQNIHAGSTYFAELLKKYNNDVSMALAAYNGGETGVNKAYKKYGKNWLSHLQEFKGINPATGRNYAEETQSYVSGVLGYYQAFSKGNMKQGTGMPEVKFDNPVDNTIYNALNELKTMFSSKGSGITLSEKSINRLAEKIGQNVSKFQPNTPTVFNVDSRR